MKYQVTKAAWFLYDIGVSYYATGTLYLGETKVYDYYKVDSITDEQKEKILSWCKDATFKGSYKEFAPEIRSCLICFPKAGFYRLKSQGVPL